MTRQEISAAALSQVGTPFHHHGRAKGVGVDCVGLLIVIARDLGILGRYEDRGYSKTVDPSRLKAELARYFDPLNHGQEIEEGDVILFRQNGNPQHVGVYVGGGYFVHADMSLGLVVRTGLRGKWVRNIEERYTWKGLGA